MIGEELRGITGASSTDRVGAIGRRNGERKAAPASSEHAQQVAAPTDATDIESFGEPVPSEFSADPLKMRTEWGWRRFLVETLIREPEQGHSSEQSRLQESFQRTAYASPSSQPAEPLSMQQLVQTLWQTLHPLLQEPSLQHQRLSVAEWMTPGSLLPFTDLKLEHFRDSRVPEKIKRAAIAEKLQGSVKMNLAPIVGSGLYYPPSPIADSRETGVFWKAERQVVVNQSGELVHHLLLAIEINLKPIELLFVFFKPTMTLHIRTDDKFLREKLTGTQEFAKMSLQALGWDLSQFSVGTLTDDEGDSAHGT